MTEATTAPAPQNGGRFKIVTDVETDFVNLWRKTGEVLSALPGEVVDLFEGKPLTGAESDAEKAEIQAFNDIHAATIAAHVEAGRLVAAPDETVTPWPRPVENIIDEAKAAGEAALAEQVKQEEAAAAQTAAEDAALAQRQLADAAAHRAPDAPSDQSGTSTPGTAETAPPA